MSDQHEFQSKMLEHTMEMRQSIAILNTKMDSVTTQLSEIKQDVSQVKNETSMARDIANEALAMAKENREDIRDMKANAKWLWGIVLSSIVAVSIAVFF